jgi:hypothetical protein
VLEFFILTFCFAWIQLEDNGHILSVNDITKKYYKLNTKEYIRKIYGKIKHSCCLDGMIMRTIQIKT